MENKLVNHEQLSISLKNTLPLYKSGAIKGENIKFFAPRSRFAVKVHSTLRKHYQVGHEEYAEIYLKKFASKKDDELVEALNEIVGEVYGLADKEIMLSFGEK